MSGLIQASRLALIVLLLCGPAPAAEREHARHVMTWAPPYGVAACKQRLRESYGGVGMKDGVTHIGLQSWRPTAKGGLERVSRFGPIDDAVIGDFQKWGTTHSVRVMLCVYNATPKGWDWGLATSAFQTHRAAFVDALVRETMRLKLDGVDIDFEGKGELDASKAPFVRFIKELSGRLHARGKELTVDTFAYKWHAPNQTWWPALLPHVDAIHVMGYAETGSGAADWRSYAFLKAAAGKHASKLVVGMPGHVDAWQGAPLSKHLAWIVDDGSVGLAIWDARLQHPAWRTEATWRTIAKIKQDK